MQESKKDPFAAGKNLPISKAAAIMGKNPQFIRVCLQRELLPFGIAVKTSSKWSYYISPSKFYDYVGIKNPDQEES
ncbi:hypothetical protein [Desulfitobacterium chlororespirans]|uniref:Uncharacterized protein n=1 Tax=Desulfitobacterium chlororespirans DSM 11544 TaxID=1121395 RepID=A0A1M7UZ90_9FIRM|nr:hypothetical protein [Desulfitobacterium chlororespirans]SHN88237.1 hypothetical protein SAMN02745215_05229 [Desulfitobacterium chlororespirans DSM 11544]